jgi:site-specific recombinase XerD
MNIKIQTHKNHLTEKKFNAIPSWKVPELTKKEIKQFVEKAKIGQVNEGKRLSEATISKYLSTLKHSLEIINKQTSKITKKDIEKFDKKLSKENLKSDYNYRSSLRIFLKWKLGEDKEKKLSGWLDCKKKKKTPDYLTEQEINKLFKNCKNPPERFLIAVLFDSGARIEEFLNIRHEDIQLPDKNSNFVKIALKEEYSKTKGRTISLYWKYSLNAVRDYLEERQEQGIKSNEAVYNKTYDAVRMFLFRLGKKVLNKEIYPHLFRHSSATYYASKINRQELCYRYGWAFSSNMPDVYISRAGMENKQLDEKFNATELEELQKQFEKYKFENEKYLEEVKKSAIENYKETENLKSAMKKVTKFLELQKEGKTKEMKYLVFGEK